MAALVEAAKKEGALNVIALPPDWVNYGDIIAGFEARYGLKITSSRPDATSAEQITAATGLKGKPSAPDVFDLSGAVAGASSGMFAPYKVTTFEDIPAALKDASGLWVADYGGYMSIGYDADRVPAPASLADLLKPAYRGKVSLSGDPTQAGSGLSIVAMAALIQGGSADDISKGVAYFKSLKAAGNLLTVSPTDETIKSGQTPVVLDFDYLNVKHGVNLKGETNWKTVIPSGPNLGRYFAQAISKDAPHPAAARLWQEYLYSDEGQNLWLKGNARPVREAAMAKAGTIDQAAYVALPPVAGTPIYLTAAQNDKAKAYLSANWAAATT
jgi:putative spermidine/putrescine transport system substrate-binding protein